MNYKGLMDSLFFNGDILMEDLHKGLTNQNFLLVLDHKQYVLRVPRADADRIVNRHHEALALQAIEGKDIDIETIYYDEASGYKVTPYLANAKTYHEYTLPDKIEKTALLMRRFHDLHCCIHESFNPLNRLHNYQKHIQTPFIDLSRFAYIESSITKLNNPHTLCHNDWVDGNILFTDDQVYLIDYEYAADNDPLFDVMSFLSENQIEDAMERNRFYAVYFNGMKEIPYQQLAIWEDFHNYLWCHWAMMMYESRNESIYKQIAYDKYEALKKRTL